MDNFSLSEEEAISFIPARMLNQLAYCERLYFLMRVHGLMLTNRDVAEGTVAHEGLHQKKLEHPYISSKNIASRPWSLESKLYGLSGKLDLVEKEGDNYTPIEVKTGTPPEIDRDIMYEKIKLSPGAWSNDQLQLAAQMLLLRDHKFQCSYGIVWYKNAERRIKIAFDEALEKAVLLALEKAKNLENNLMPPPLINSQKCYRCSLAPVCLPDETNLLRDRKLEPRRITPARPSGTSLYLLTPGTFVTQENYRIKVERNGELLQLIPLDKVDKVFIYGKGTIISGPLIQTLAELGKPVIYASKYHKIYGASLPTTWHATRLREQQFIKLHLPELKLLVAKTIIRSKIKNQRTMIMRNAKEREEAKLKELAMLINKIDFAPDLDVVRGLEGKASQIYFEMFPKMLKPEWRSLMNGRNKRPPRDQVNCCLSFIYTILTAEVATMLHSVGLDFMYGALHATRPGRPSLALDLIEPFRPIIADSVVIRALNTFQLSPKKDFESDGFAITLKGWAKKKLLEAYEKRLNEEVIHPIFKYRVSYRRALELEARLLARWLEGDIQTWKPLEVR